MVERVLLVCGLAFGTSGLLYERMHQSNVPELARYGVGGILIIVSAYILFGFDVAAKVATAVTLAGAGVSFYRLWAVLCD